MPWRSWNKPSVLGSKRAPQLQANSADELSQAIWVVYRDPQELQMTVTWSVLLAIVLNALLSKGRQWSGQVTGGHIVATPPGANSYQ
jgi:hypothetical protein